MHPPSSDGHNQSVSPSSPNDKGQSTCPLQVGQVFIPRRVFNSGVFVPDSLLACRLVSNGAKLLWARLARYAGTRGQCFPLLSTLAADLGFSERQLQRYLAELVSAGFLRARQRGFNRSNLYEFLWHPALASPGVAAPAMEQTEQQTHNPLQETTVHCRVAQKPFQSFHTAEPEEVAATGQAEGVAAPAMEQLEQRTHNPLQEKPVLFRAVQMPFQLFQTAEPEELAATGQEDRTTDVASPSTTELSSCVSTTGLSSWKNDFKNRIEMQSRTPRILEVVEIPRGSACTAKPLTPEDNAVRDMLVGFQAELQVAGTILSSTVRRVMSLVSTERLPEALRFVAEKLYWRRRRESSYRRHVGWGFVLRVLEQDLNAPIIKETVSTKWPVEPPVNLTGTTSPWTVSQQRPPGSPRRGGGLVRAGEILKDLGPLETGFACR